MTSTKSKEKKKSIVHWFREFVCMCVRCMRCCEWVFTTNHRQIDCTAQRCCSSSRREIFSAVRILFSSLQTARFVSTIQPNARSFARDFVSSQIISAWDYKPLNGWTRHFTYGNAASAIEAKTSRIIITKPNYSVSLDDNFMDGICNSFLFSAIYSSFLVHLMCVCELSLVKRYRTCHS